MDLNWLVDTLSNLNNNPPLLILGVLLALLAPLIARVIPLPIPLGLNKYDVRPLSRPGRILFTVTLELTALYAIAVSFVVPRSGQLPSPVLHLLSAWAALLGTMWLGLLLLESWFAARDVQVPARIYHQQRRSPL